MDFRSNIAQIAKFSYDVIDGTYDDRALAVRAQGGHAIVGGAITARVQVVSMPHWPRDLLACTWSSPRAWQGFTGKTS